MPSRCGHGDIQWSPLKLKTDQTDKFEIRASRKSLQAIKTISTLWQISGLKAALLKDEVLWRVTPCRLIPQLFKCCFLLTLAVEQSDERSLLGKHSVTFQEQASLVFGPFTHQ
jgi:hypothetical protein